MNLPVRLHQELTLGRRQLSGIFGRSAPCTLKAGEIMEAAICQNAIYRLRAGWACQFHNFAATHSPIIDVYLPGDVIGLDTLLRTRPLNEVQALTSVTVEVIPAQDGLIELMADRPVALYLIWLLAQRQRRADRLIAAFSGLEARGRIALMFVDFYDRLYRRKLITGAIYNFPLTQSQIGRYLGLTVVHVNRVLRSLRNDGMATLERHCVTILDLERLTNLARNGNIPNSSSVWAEGRLSDEISPSVSVAPPQSFHCSSSVT